LEYQALVVALQAVVAFQEVVALQVVALVFQATIMAMSIMLIGVECMIMMRVFATR
jgi:hypothetical protein